MLMCQSPRREYLSQVLPLEILGSHTDVHLLIMEIMYLVWREGNTNYLATREPFKSFLMFRLPYLSLPRQRSVCCAGSPWLQAVPTSGSSALADAQRWVAEGRGPLVALCRPEEVLLDVSSQKVCVAQKRRGSGFQVQPVGFLSVKCADRSQALVEGACRVAITPPCVQPEPKPGCWT